MPRGAVGLRLRAGDFRSVAVGGVGAFTLRVRGFSRGCAPAGEVDGRAAVLYLRRCPSRYRVVSSGRGRRFRWLGLNARRRRSK